ncbi:MAG: tetratricopeptide repeat protein [Kiritimatiellaeota bacterium]|nr:tetratricopeptide repeat protein [Kiritimatiellota bacterium]
MGKSLTPLIAVVAVVVILTIIIINIDTDVENASRYAQKTKEPKVELSSHLVKPEKFNSRIYRRGNNESFLLEVDKLLAVAQKFLASGHTDEAENELRTILVFQPNNLRALTLLGGILFYSHRYAEAELIFRRQVRIAPKNHQAYNRLGSVLAKQKKFKEAIDNASTAVGMKPESGEAQINLAGMYAAVGNKKLALKHLRKAIDLLGRAVLPLTEDSVFDQLRDLPEFQEIVSNAAAGKPKTHNEKSR